MTTQEIITVLKADKENHTDSVFLTECYNDLLSKLNLIQEMEKGKTLEEMRTKVLKDVRFIINN